MTATTYRGYTIRKSGKDLWKIVTAPDQRPFFQRYVSVEACQVAINCREDGGRVMTPAEHAVVHPNGLRIGAPIKEETAPAPATTTPPTVTKEIGEYDPDSHDYPAFVIFEDGHKEYIGSRRTQHDASLLASDYIIQWYGDHHTPEAAARMIREELEQEGRHADLARDMGGVWMDGGDPEAAHEWTPEYLLSLLTKEAECAICHTQQQCFNAGESGYICERCAAPDEPSLSEPEPTCTVHGCTNPATREGLIPGLPVCDTCEPIAWERLRHAILGAALVEG